MTEDNVNIKKMKDILIIMLRADVFSIRNGKAILNFDNNGELMNIQVEQQIYKKIKPNNNDKKI